jgi:hypothetical protein
MPSNNNYSKWFVILILINGLFLANLFFETISDEGIAQEIKNTDVGRYQLQYVPSNDGSDPRYILLDTSTGIFWEAKGHIENVDNFCVYSASDLKTAKIGNHTVGMHKHK